MKDVQLHRRLVALGIAPAAASTLTAQIRDRIHPVAALAVTKAADHLTGLALYDAGVGFAGLDEYGYYYDGTAGLLKKVKKAVKKVAKTAVKVVKKVALPVAAIVAAPVTGGASVAAYGAIKAASIGKKASKAANEASIAQTNAMITGEPVPVKADGRSQSSVKLARGGKKRVSRDLSKASDKLAKEVVESGAPLDTAALMQALLQNQSGGGGAAFSSPAGQAILQDVAAQGVEATSAGPTLPAWVKPVGIGVGALGLVWLLSRRK